MEMETMILVVTGVVLGCSIISKLIFAMDGYAAFHWDEDADYEE